MGLQASVPVDHGVAAERIKPCFMFTITGRRFHNLLALPGELKQSPHLGACMQPCHVSSRPTSPSPDSPVAYHPLLQDTCQSHLWPETGQEYDSKSHHRRNIPTTPSHPGTRLGRSGEAAVISPCDIETASNRRSVVAWPSTPAGRLVAML